MPELGVNIDHVATLRQAGARTSPIRFGRRRWRSWAGPMASRSICAKIAATFRTAIWKCCGKTVTVKLNLELACASDVVAIACRVKPDQATLVPERREEVTTEGGLDVEGQRKVVDRGGEAVAGCGHLRQPVSRSRCAAVGTGAIDRRRGRGTAHRPLLFGQARQRARQGTRCAGDRRHCDSSNGAWACTPATA